MKRPPVPHSVVELGLPGPDVEARVLGPQLPATATLEASHAQRREEPRPGFLRVRLRAALHRHGGVAGEGGLQGAAPAPPRTLLPRRATAAGPRSLRPGSTAPRQHSPARRPPLGAGPLPGAAPLRLLPRRASAPGPRGRRSGSAAPRKRSAAQRPLLHAGPWPRVAPARLLRWRAAAPGPPQPAARFRSAAAESFSTAATSRCCDTAWGCASTAPAPASRNGTASASTTLAPGLP